MRNRCPISEASTYSLHALGQVIVAYDYAYFLYLLLVFALNVETKPRCRVTCLPTLLHICYILTGSLIGHIPPQVPIWGVPHVKAERPR
jgi:hypothetical protein